MEIKREQYIKRLAEQRRNGFIKVITGLRRVGKSYILNRLFYRYLKTFIYLDLPKNRRFIYEIYSG